MVESIVTRIRELQAERQKLVEHLEQLTAEAERTRHLISAYDGGIGELGRLAEQAQQTQAEAPEAEG